MTEGSVGLRIARSDYEAMIAHARADLPNECCGVIVGKGDTALRLYPLENILHSPVEYRVDPLALLRVFEEIEGAGLDLIGSYHSHTRSEAYPSPTDRLYAPGLGDSLFVIISLAPVTQPLTRRREPNQGVPYARAFRIRKDGSREIVTEAPIIVFDERNTLE